MLMLIEYNIYIYIYIYLQKISIKHIKQNSHISIKMQYSHTNYPSQQQMFADLIQQMSQTSIIDKYIDILINENIKKYIYHRYYSNQQNKQNNTKKNQILQQLSVIGDVKKMQSAYLGFKDTVKIIPIFDQQNQQYYDYDQQNMNNTQYVQVCDNINNFADVLSQLYQQILKYSMQVIQVAKNLNNFETLSKIIKTICKQMAVIIQQQKYTVQRLISYDIYNDNVYNWKTTHANTQKVNIINKNKQNLLKNNKNDKNSRGYEMMSTGQIYEIDQNQELEENFEFQAFGGSQTSCLDKFYDYATEQVKYNKQARNINKVPHNHTNIHYYPKQKIKIFQNLNPNVFQWIEPELHRKYLSQVSSAYHQVVPFKIKYVLVPSISQKHSPLLQKIPQISIKNYFKQDTRASNQILYYLQPKTKKILYYSLSQISKLLSITKQYINEKKLNISWTFGQCCSSVCTPCGRIYVINCRTTHQKLDPSFYQISSIQVKQSQKTFKISNRGPLPYPMRESGFIYCGKHIYVIGGSSQKQKCTTRAFRYSIKQKKWLQICQSNIATRKPTLCTYKDRYIIKLAGLNQFNFINKCIQIYDCQTDRWSIVQLNISTSSQEIIMLQDCLAVQIDQNKIYIFGGRNANNYSADTGLILQITEIRQKIKAPAKVGMQIWSANIGKRNLLSFWGMMSNGNVVVHNNCIYVMRTQNCKMITN